MECSQGLSLPSPTQSTLSSQSCCMRIFALMVEGETIPKHRRFWRHPTWGHAWPRFQMVDDPVPDEIHDTWLQRRTELHLLSQKAIPWCYLSTKSRGFPLKSMVSQMPPSSPMQLWYTYVLLMHQTKSTFHWWCPKAGLHPSSGWLSLT